MTTGWPPGMLQDDCRDLSRWLSNKPDARYVLRKNLVMKTITSELIGSQLDCAVAKAAGMRYVQMRKGKCWAWHTNNRSNAIRFKPSTDWAQGGPIIGSASISFDFAFGYGETKMDWEATSIDDLKMGGDTPLIAAMRCYVASKLGDEVEIPEAQPVQPVEVQRVGLSDVFRDRCKECAREKKSRADNKEWQEGVKRGNEIVAAMARSAINQRKQND